MEIGQTLRGSCKCRESATERKETREEVSVGIVSETCQNPKKGFSDFQRFVICFSCTSVYSENLLPHGFP